MKALIFIITLTLCFNIYAQEGIEKSNVFVRVYDLQGKKINKGRIISDTDTVLYIKQRIGTVTIPIDQIGFIKTKHSSGNNILFGATIGVLHLAIIGITTADPDAWLGWTAVEGATMGAVGGGILGAAIGAITILFKNSETYIINGDVLKWRTFKQAITGYTP